jgi:diacylglycerol kinase family enzyme
MRISLLYSERAGDGTPVRTLREALEAEGHEVVHLVEKDAELERSLDDRVELVVAAGGDGTVRRAAQVLSGRSIPLAIVPVGTANNIAKSLEIGGPVREIVRGWHGASELEVDLGVISGGWGDHPFVESVGGGLVPVGIAAMKVRPEEDAETDVKLRVALQTYLNVLAHLRPRRWMMSLDGVESVRELLLWEVLNMPAVGPNLVLAPNVSPADGLLSVVAVGAENRESLTDYLRSRIDAADPAAFPVPAQPAQRIEFSGPDEIHVDDEVRSRTGGNDMATIEIRPGAVKVLAPPSSTWGHQSASSS